MIHVDFDPASLHGKQKTWWDAWTKRAQTATAAAIKAWETSNGKTKPALDDAIWGDLKHWLLNNIFKDKCAYCETLIGATRAPGHAEHFRPKSGTKNKDNIEDRYVTGATIDHDGSKIDHPGYFWLAYNWKNLVPSCTNCNTGPGKKNMFPINGDHILIKKLSDREVKRLTAAGVGPLASKKWKRFHYLDPDHLDTEEDRLLLHPYRDKPRDHIKFGIKGIEAARKINGKISENGKESIRVFALNDADLRIARHKNQEAAFANWVTMFCGEALKTKNFEKAKQVAGENHRRFLSASPPYSAAIEDYVEIKTKSIQGRLRNRLSTDHLANFLAFCLPSI